ncbi:hypothetical protein [Haloarchaeobius iranensis]|uniref:hypothetical protein n=1 Tax=Haloarchaeobius iranensis TaxID=996166 RepID=UPI0011133F0B|nr:hypothetical protein [Haloarchaeobius iranensis]
MRAFDLRSIVNNFYGDILSDKSVSNWEAYSLLVIPFLLAQVAVVRPIDEGFVGTMSTALAILFGFTFSSLLTTAKYTPKDDRNEERVVKKAQLGTSYALLVNLVSLITIVMTSIAVIDYSQLSTLAATATSAVVYFFLFHYLATMLYLMRYLYLLAIGGAFREEESEPQHQEEEEVEEITL